MFGKKKSKKDPVIAEFDLEKELKQDPGKLRATKEQLDVRTHQLKKEMRQGQDKEEFDNSQTLLHGYLAAQKVVGRVNRKLA